MRQLFAMNSVDGIKEKIKEIDLHYITGLKDIFSGYDDLQKFILEKKKLIEVYKTTGDINVLSELSSDLKSSKRKPVKKNLTSVSAVSDNNSESSVISETSTRPRRKASQVAANSIRKNTEESPKLFANVKVKVERISEIVEGVEEDYENVVVKQEPVEMPPPAVPTKKTRATRQKVVEPRESSRSRKTKSNKDVEEVVKPPRASSRKNKKDTSYAQKNVSLNVEETSDVDGPVTEKNLTEETQKIVENGKRSISTERSKKQRSISSGRVRNVSNCSLTNGKTHSQDNEWETEENADCEPSIYEDAESNGGTFILPEDKQTEVIQGKTSATKKAFQEIPENIPAVNNTFVVENNNEQETETHKSKISNTNLNSTKIIKKGKNSNDMKFTETKIQKTKKEVQALDKTPVRKKIEAFEKMGTPVVPMRITRTKSKKQNKENAEQQQGGETVTKEKTKATACTPLATNRILPSSSTMSQTMSALKASKEYFIEREKRRKEKESEGLKKKEALKQAQLEEKRRIREEKEQKAKLQREALEKEKQLLLKKKLQKQKEESEKKKLDAKQKLEEKRQAEEEERNRLEEENLLLLKKKQEEKLRLEAKKAEQVVDKPIYLTTKAPLLPTYDCYDTDDENCDAMPRPAWTYREKIRESTRTMMYIDDKLKNTLFCVKAKTVDLTEIFQNIDPRKLRRNSSAIWKTKPRFTLMESHYEF